MTFVIQGEPRGKQRPRFSRRSRTMYTPSETTAYEEEVRAEYLKAGGVKHTGEVALTIIAYDKIPEAATKAMREKIAAGLRPMKKPDVDNVAKIIMDGLNGAAYEDDKQVTVLTIGKWYSDEPRVLVEVTEL